MTCARLIESWSGIHDFSVYLDRLGSISIEDAMRKLISRKQHGVADYTYVPTVMAAPNLARFARNTTPARLSRGFASASLVNTLFTRAEWGAVKVLPFKAHLAIDAATGVAAPAAPWLFGFSNDRRARNTFLAMGVTALVVTLLSRPEEMRSRS
jgi:hypothetical protein